MQCPTCGKEGLTIDECHFTGGKCWPCHKKSMRGVELGYGDPRAFLDMPPPPPPMRNPSVLTEPVHPIYASVTIGVFLLGLLIGYTCA